MDRAQILEEISRVIGLVNELREPDAQISCDEKTILYGSAGSFDSLGLVSFLMDVEQAVATRASRPLVLTDEHAMSQRRNPFRSIGALADYVLERLNGQPGCKNAP